MTAEAAGLVPASDVESEQGPTPSLAVPSEPTGDTPSPVGEINEMRGYMVSHPGSGHHKALTLVLAASVPDAIEAGRVFAEEQAEESVDADEVSIARVFFLDTPATVAFYDGECC